MTNTLISVLCEGCFHEFKPGEKIYLFPQSPVGESYKFKNPFCHECCDVDEAEDWLTIEQIESGEKSFLYT